MPNWRKSLKFSCKALSVLNLGELPYLLDLFLKFSKVTLQRNLSSTFLPKNWHKMASGASFLEILKSYAIA